MKTPFRGSLPVLCALLFLALGPGAVGAAEERKPTAQQQRMTDCNRQAGSQALKGEARKQFMSACLKGDGAASSQQEKMKRCNQRAGEQQLKGEARKQFMSTCLKG